MRVYAVLSSGARDHGDLEATEYPWVLASYDNADRIAAANLAHKPGLLLDSGAFAVWTKGSTIDVDSYGLWARGLVDHRPDTVVSNLDVIPGSFGSGAPTAAVRLEAAHRGMRNADRLRGEYGLRVMEVYHRYEPLELLDTLIARRQPGEPLALGGLVGMADPSTKAPFVAQAFRRLAEVADGGPLIRVHGFGVSPDSKLGIRFPWFSMDSSAWVTRRYNREVAPNGAVARSSMGRAFGADVVQVFHQRRLRYWIEAQNELSAFWADRGVAHLDDTG